ncbi:energy transducer TonB family protein [Celeribacter neptunius]|uniref:Protein TonB n=1 Tax=Celeribacter neptunius TaxID=588602 RepID=A0A1I3WU53_9RHOB|nr:energy transducer TonB [Celeribacter neptunius]SFK11048.1 protein TonB [Celeribacter neptunius]
MTRVLTAGLFLSLALGAHLALAAVAFRSGADGASAAGEGGEAALSLQASTLAVADMVAQWQRPVAAPIETLATQRGVPQIPKADVGIDLPQVDVVPELPALAVPMTSEQSAGAEVFTAPSAPSVPPPAAPEPKAQAKPETRTAQTRPAVSGADHASQDSRAAGAGGGQAAGQSAAAASGGSLSGAERQSALAQWRAQINRSIARKTRAVRGRGAVLLEISIAESGKLLAVRVVRGSGNASLDAAAVEAVKRVGRFPAAPKGLSGTRFDFGLPMRFE